MEEMFPLVYNELRRMAARKLRSERDGHTLCTTALVHEAWLELTKLNRIQWQNRAHFLAVAAQAMRRILIDYAVARRQTEARRRPGARIARPRRCAGDCARSAATSSSRSTRRSRA